MSKIFDVLMALAFLGVSLFGATAAYSFIRREALMQVRRGLSSTYMFTHRITNEKFDWEK